MTLYFDKIREEQKEFNLDALMHRMVVSDRYPAHKIAWVITEKWDNAWCHESMYYIGEKSQNGIPGRYEGVLEFFALDPVERHEKYGPITMPRAKVDVRGKIRIGNGRHRYAVMRDLGAKKIPISMDEESIHNAERFGLI